MNLKNTTFENNIALLGGAIYFDCPAYKTFTCEYLIDEECKFINNTAHNKGGAIAFSEIVPQILTNNFA